MILSHFKAAKGLQGKDVAGTIDLTYKGQLICRERYSSRKERSQTIERWRDTIPPYHDNEYYFTIKNEL